eukprot:TRINITY_DN757_c0_g2_i1.p1 TRINITY_DN757_c0_g2~~TRINITY_DN757_c0_g2_i1.p1  ORF type:complete len:121 (+),score=18.99 TRINITY_DN757_c0_g2_i1:243-605(+)
MESMFGAPNDCYYYLASFYCAICDPNTFTFLSGVPTEAPTFTICQNFCTAGYQACADDLNRLAPPGVNVSSPQQFCQMLQNDDGDDAGMKMVISTSNTACFGNNVPIQQIASSGCLPGQN